MSKEQPTLGEQRVRASFNVAEGEVAQHVDAFKTKIAELIDMVETWKDIDPRLAAMAQSSLEIACMWAVKLVTTPPVGEAK